MSQTSKIIISIILIAVAVAGRLLPHMWNFTPIIAIALFAGVYLGRHYMWLLPLIAMIISDFFIGFYDAKLMIFVYVSFALVGIFSYLIRENKNIKTIFMASISASVLFFIITNWAVWQFSPWYEKTLSGLLRSYTLAIPFFRNAVLGDLVYTLSFFGVYELAILLKKKLQFAKTFGLRPRRQIQDLRKGQESFPNLILKR